MFDLIKLIGWLLVCVLLIALVAGGVGSLIYAYILHIIWIVSTFTSPVGITFGQFVFGFMGSIFPPLGIVHGFTIWF